MSRLFPPEVLTFFESNNKGKTAKEMADLLNATFGTSYTTEQVKSCRARHHWVSGLSGRFQPGQEAHNKGKKGRSYPGMEKTQFKKGHTPHNHRPVGSERVNADGYLERKVAEPKTWKGVHIINWERVHGPVPEGYALIFKDQNPLHCEVDNLQLVSRGELAVMNRRGLCCSNPEATEAGLTLARYVKATTAQKKKRKKARETS